MPISSSQNSIHHGSPKLDQLGSESGHNTAGDQPISPSAMCGVKRKSVTDSLAETTAFERESRLQVVNAQIAAKNLRSSQVVQGRLEREALKQERLERVELARLAHEREEAMARRAHDLMMIERQAQLEMIRAGHIPSIDPSIH